MMYSYDQDHDGGTIVSIHMVLGKNGKQCGVLRNEAMRLGVNLNRAGGERRT